MFPWIPPLWVPVTFVVVTIGVNLITIISKKIGTEQLNDAQNNEPYNKRVAYWTHAIASRIATVVNIITVVVAIPLLLIGTTWLGSKFPHIFFITMCALMWILSLCLTWISFRIRDKSHDNDAQEDGAPIDPNDRAAINYAITWILLNVAFDGFMWLVVNSSTWKETIPQ